MKKLIAIGLAVGISMSALTGCGLLGEKSNGLILYGSDKQVEGQITKYKDEIKENHSYTYKLLTNENQKTVAISEATAKELIKQGLLREIKGNDSTAPLKSLPSVNNGDAILFSKSESDKIKIDGKELKTTYKGNVIIGNGRTLGDNFLIVTEKDFENIHMPENKMGVLHFKKDPKNEVVDVSKEVEKFQMVTIEK